jgi:hypothetical protein
MMKNTNTREIIIAKMSNFLHVIVGEKESAKKIKRKTIYRKIPPIWHKISISCHIG